MKSFLSMLILVPVQSSRRLFVSTRMHEQPYVTGARAERQQLNTDTLVPYSSEFTETTERLAHDEEEIFFRALTNN